MRSNVELMLLAGTSGERMRTVADAPSVIRELSREGNDLTDILDFK